MKHNVIIEQRVVGYVEGETYFKRIQGSKHILRTPPAIAFGVAALKQAEYFGAVNVEITESETNEIYYATIEFIRENGFKIQRGGWEEQIALPLNKWDTKTKRLLNKQQSLF